jgi:hypothetical protein
MMKKRTFIFDGSGGATQAMNAVLNHYANVAYPPGGSDCAATSRQAIMEIVDKISQDEMCEISRKQRPMLKAAVKWFYTESEYADMPGNDSMYQRLLSQLEKIR